MTRLKLFLFALIAAGALMGRPAMAAPAGGAIIGLSGIVHTVCEASFSQPPVMRDGAIDLGQMTRRCNDGEGYRVILHTPAGLRNASLLLQGRRIPLSSSGQTVIVDAPDMERNISEPAQILFATTAPLGDFSVQLETVAKGPVY